MLAAGEQPYVVPWKPDRGDYARKVNWGAHRAVSMGFDWFLLRPTMFITTPAGLAPPSPRTSRPVHW